MLTTLVIVIAQLACSMCLLTRLAYLPPRVVQINVIKPYLDHHRELARYQKAYRLCPNTAFSVTPVQKLALTQKALCWRNMIDSIQPRHSGTGASTSLRRSSGSKCQLLSEDNLSGR